MVTRSARAAGAAIANAATTVTSVSKRLIALPHAVRVDFEWTGITLSVRKMSCTGCSKVHAKSCGAAHTQWLHGVRSKKHVES
jgi:hypothetical protein